MNTREDIRVGDTWTDIAREGRSWWRVNSDFGESRGRGRGKGKGGGKKVKQVDTTNLVVKSSILL